MLLVDAMRGWSGLALAYGAVQGPMLAGLIQGRARFSKLLLSPALAAPLTALTGIAMAAAAPLLHNLGARPSLAGPRRRFADHRRRAVRG